jgi:hypothetical protein
MSEVRGFELSGPELLQWQPSKFSALALDHSVTLAVLLTIEMFTRREEFVCDAAKHSDFASSVLLAAPPRCVPVRVRRPASAREALWFYSTGERRLGRCPRVKSVPHRAQEPRAGCMPFRFSGEPDRVDTVIPWQSVDPVRVHA